MCKANRAICIAVTCIAVAFTANAYALTSVERRMVAQRACEAAIWAMPAVSLYDIEISVPRDLGGTAGDVVYFSRPMTLRHGFLTVNDVTPYVVANLTTEAGFPYETAERLLIDERAGGWYFWIAGSKPGRISFCCFGCMVRATASSTAAGCSATSRGSNNL